MPRPRIRYMLALLVLGLLYISQASSSNAQTPVPPPPPHGPVAVGNPIPRTGDQKLLVVLVDFSDRPGLFTGQAWQANFFNPATFADFYKEVSYNQLRYTGDVVGLSGGAPVTNSANVAYVRLPNPITYYADGQYGFKVGPGQFPKNNGGVVYHAVQALDAAGFNFAPYTNPANNSVENVVVVFAGSTHVYTQDPINSLEATAYRITWARDGAGPYVTQGGQTIDNYTFCPDQRFNLSGEIAYIGVCAHEHGHALGMPDLYDYSYTTSGAGNFDLMAYGTYAGTSGLRPFHFGAFSKEFFSWVTPTVAAPGTNNYTLQPAETHANFLRLYPNGNPNSPEYFLLENRQPLGFDQSWTSAGLCAGLVIWHVDQTIVQTYPNRVNTLPTSGGPPHQGVVVVEADGGFEMITPPIPLNYGDCADTWTVGQTWNAASNPNSNLWDGAPSNLAVTVAGTCANGGLLLTITVGGAPLTLKPSLPWPQIPFTNTTLYLPTLMRNAC